MPWICDCCGWENPGDGLPLRHKIPCICCGRPRGSRAAAIKDLQMTITVLEHHEAGTMSCANNLKDHIGSLESEISELTLELNDILAWIDATRSALQVARVRLAALQAYEPPSRHIAGDQHTLEVEA